MIPIAPKGNGTIRRATAADVPEVVALAHAVWPVAYGGILSSEQMCYMLDWMYSRERLVKEMEREGVRFWLAFPERGVDPCGFASLGPTTDARVMKLHKLYVLPSQQKGGWGRRLVQTCVDEARKCGATAIRLAVNKHNESAQAFYLRLGFQVRESVRVDIGRGFVMDDFILELSLEETPWMPGWVQALVDPPFRHPMGLRQGDLARFMAPTAEAERLRRERRFWMSHAPEHHLVIRSASGSEKLLEAWEDCCGVWEARERGDLRDRCRHLGERMEFDWLLLDAQLRFQIGSVCFPSAWAPEEKAGRHLHEIHGPVPGLNESLGPAIQRFFDRLKPGQAWERSNWGMCRTPELNQHPARGLKRLDGEMSGEEIWLRVEHQLLWGWPENVGYLFGIRVEHVGLEEIQRQPGACSKLRGLIESMPEEVARYKGILGGRKRILQLLSGVS